MSQVISFENYVPAARFDSVPWTEVRIEEGAAFEGPFTQIDVIPISPVDADPSDPAARSFTTDQASDTVGLWYRLIFADASGDSLAPLFPIQNAVTRPYYATADELALLLKVKVDQRRTQLERVLASAAAEIDAEVGRLEPYAEPPALAVQVNLDRAFEHWQSMTTPWGAVGLGGEAGPGFVRADTWERHAQKLAPLKERWALA